MSLTLLQKAENGNRQALKKLIIESSEYIYKLAFIHTKFEDDAIEIMKNTVDYMENNFNKILKNKNFYMHITKITIKHINEYMEEVGIVENENISYMNEDNKINLYNAIDLLDVYKKNVIILKYFYNMSYEEVGNILDMNESTVKIYIRNSFKIMKEIIEEEYTNGRRKIK